MRSPHSSTASWRPPAQSRSTSSATPRAPRRPACCSASTRGASPAERPKIRNVIGIAGAGHGTTLMGIGSGLSRLRDKLEGKFDLSKLLRKTLGQCAEDQVVGSDVVAHINRNGDTVPGVTYTMIGSKYDEIVTPWRIQFLEAGEGATAHNFSVQDDNPTDMSDHLSLLYSPRTLDHILERLSDSDSGEDGAYRRDHPMVTGRVLPLLGLIGKAGQVGR